MSPRVELKKGGEKAQKGLAVKNQIDWNVFSLYILVKYIDDYRSVNTYCIYIYIQKQIHTYIYIYVTCTCVLY